MTLRRAKFQRAVSVVCAFVLLILMVRGKGSDFWDVFRFVGLLASCISYLTASATVRELEDVS